MADSVASGEEGSNLSRRYRPRAVKPDYREADVGKPTALFVIPLIEDIDELLDVASEPCVLGKLIEVQGDD